MKPRHSPEILSLGYDFYDPVKPAQFPMTKPRYLNKSAAAKLGLDHLQSDADWIQKCALFELWNENLNECLALRYHGHQFRHYNPDLGDGRGFLYAQFRGLDGRLYDLGTKGSGQTPYSRAGDGRLTLKGAFREALATEMLESLGVNTSKTFCFFETGESLDRNDEPSPTRSAVLTRMSHGHIRIGTFQRLAYLKQPENIKKLTQYCLDKYYPEVFNSSESTDELHLAEKFLSSVTGRLACLTAEYMMSGFVHGVLNSDNINISGESFDYGPYRFLPQYDPNFTAAYFDQQGLYSYGRQPMAIFWNLNQFASSLMLAYPGLEPQKQIESFGDLFSNEVLKILLKRLNLKSKNSNEDQLLLKLFFQFLEKTPEAFFEQTFFDLHSFDYSRCQRSPQKDLYTSVSFTELGSCLEKFEIADPEIANRSYFQSDRPCTLLIDEIESLWKLIAENDDWSGFESKLKQIRAFRGIYNSNLPLI